MNLAIKAPWRERNGKLSALKAVTFTLLFAPALYVFGVAATSGLGPKPVTELIHSSGQWGLRLLLISLAVTPLRKIADWPKLIVVRRMLGVAAFAYIVGHLCLYIVDQHYDLGHVASEIALRFYLTIGFVALLGLAALAATSTDAMIRRLGAQRWNRLHSLVYGIAVLGILHFYIQSKADVSEAVVMSGLFFELMIYRIAQKRGAPVWAATLVGGVLGIGLTVLAEATWYAIVRHYDFFDVLAANIDPDMFPRPAFWVAVAGAAALAIYAARHLRSLAAKQKGRDVGNAGRGRDAKGGRAAYAERG
jgi:sulfoxide reductase heme-binding subunit YedZ